MLDKDLLPENLYAVAQNTDLLSPALLKEIREHKSAWPALVSWSELLESIDRAIWRTVPVPPPPQPEEETASGAGAAGDAAPAGKEGRQWPKISFKPTGRQLHWLVAAIIVAISIGLGGAWWLSSNKETTPVYGEAAASVPQTPSSSQNKVSPRLSVAGDGFTCIFEGRNVTCSGLNNRGQLGGGSPEDNWHSFTIEQVPLQAVAGAEFVCYTPGKGVYCWGDNQWRQVGGNEEISGLSSIRLLEDSRIDVLTAGDIHACALSSSKVYCWGSDYSGQLGGGEQGETGSSVKRVSLPDEPAVRTIIASRFTTCAYGSKVFCWGANDDRRISGDDAKILPPTEVVAP